MLKTTKTSAVNLAIQNGYCQIVELLLQNGADYNHSDSSGYNPITMAIVCNNLEMVRILLSQGADLNQFGLHGLTPLIQAIFRAKLHPHGLEIVRFLIEHGADVNLRDRDNENETPILHAIRFNNLEIIKILYKNGAKLDVIMEDGFSHLTSACLFNMEEIVQFLVENGAKIDPWADDQVSPILAAIEARHINIIKYLAMNGACLKTKAKGHPDSPFSGSTFDPIELALAHRDTNIAKMMIFLKNEEEK